MSASRKAHAYVHALVRNADWNRQSRPMIATRAYVKGYTEALTDVLRAITRKSLHREKSLGELRAFVELIEDVRKEGV